MNTEHTANLALVESTKPPAAWMVPAPIRPVRKGWFRRLLGL